MMVTFRLEVTVVSRMDNDNQEQQRQQQQQPHHAAGR
jgi:hypothetical protein